MDDDRQDGIITLLVVDDEPLVRMNTAEHLAEAGFRVVEASDGAQAIEALKADDTISGVFSDIQMPGAVDGFSLRRWVEQNRPRVVVLLTSGVSNVQSAAGHLGRPRWIVFKPYDMRDVEKRLRELLSAGSGAVAS
jgi:two-component system, response regulator PdtaR